MTSVAPGIDIAYHVRMLHQRLAKWWKSESTDDVHRILAKYEDQAEAHRQAAETARNVGAEFAYAHQMELKAWYEREAEKLRKKLARREQKGSPPI